MEKKEIIALLLLTAIFCIAPISLVSATGPDPQLYVDPPESNAWVCQVFTVDITVLNVDDLYGFEFKLDYNTSQLDCTGITEGPLLQGGGTTLIYKEEINETTGRAFVAISLLGVEYGVSGSGVLATLEFNATGTGVSQLHLHDTLFSDSGANPITHLTYDGVVEITWIPGDINGDGTVDIFDAVLLSGAFGSQPGHPQWNPDTDLNADGIVNIFDAVILGSNYGKSAC